MFYKYEEEISNELESSKKPASVEAADKRGISRSG
jgi:hypothetical protein